MTEHLARIYEFPSGRRLHPEPSHDEISPVERNALYADLEHHERAAEGIRRRLKLLLPELGVPPVYMPGEGQLSIETLNGEQQ